MFENFSAFSLCYARSLVCGFKSTLYVRMPVGDSNDLRKTNKHDLSDVPKYYGNGWMIFVNCGCIVGLCKHGIPICRCWYVSASNTENFTINFLRLFNYQHSIWTCRIAVHDFNLNLKPQWSIKRPTTGKWRPTPKMTIRRGYHVNSGFVLKYKNCFPSNELCLSYARERWRRKLVITMRSFNFHSIIETRADREQLIARSTLIDVMQFVVLTKSFRCLFPRWDEIRWKLFVTRENSNSITMYCRLAWNSFMFCCALNRSHHATK